MAGRRSTSERRACAAASTASTSPPTARPRWSATTRPAARSPAARAGSKRGKLQLQLYILAARERLGLDPVGGLYTALGARDDRRPRGNRDSRTTPGSGSLRDQGARRPLRRRGVRRRARRARARRRRRRRQRCARAGSTATRSAAAVPRYCTLPADLPARARARARGRDRRDGQRRAPATETAALSEFAPTAEQRAAIDARDRDVFCEAGAGTGKTRVLVDRYCDAVEHDELGIEAILAFTFTERAAAELRSRVRRELARRSRSGARARRQTSSPTRLARASRETERAWVTTIHGFCRRLLAAHPAAAGIDPRFRVLAESEASRLRRRGPRRCAGRGRRAPIRARSR